MGRTFNPSEHEDGMDGGRLVPAGIYFAKVEKPGDIERKRSKSSGADYFDVKLRVMEGEFKGCVFWDTFSTLENALWKLGHFCVSIGQNSEFDIDSDAAVRRAIAGRVGKCQTKVEEYEGKQRTKVDRWLKMEPEERTRFPYNGGGAGLPDGPSENAAPPPSGGTSQHPNDDIPF